MKLLKFMGILISLAVFFSLVPVAWAAEDTVSGSFTPTNVLPTVTVLNVYDSGNSTVTNMSPQVYYWVKVTAGDGNTIDDIDQLDVELFYDPTGADPAAPGVADTQNCSILTWDKDGGGSEWVIDAGGGTTWTILTANCTKPGNMTAASGEWVFVITVGKVATESVGAANWDVYGVATDDVGTGDMFTRDKEVLWYGEISTGASANFGSVDNDSGFADNTNEVSGISVTYITNGDYDQQVKSDASWAGASFTANYDATGVCNDGQEFSLRAFDSDVFGSAVQVDTTGVSIDATGTLTAEAGNTVATNTVWLRIALVFQNDTYSGNIVYIIADR
ncbi:MAG: hypothetical protein A2Y89_02275 [Chloroflexi bacterium RBG_13_51_18]|nr:MAG: hypothetical protein A2Y89_02275 [Chloroflexi bacterium RBG_13_51_18]